MKVNNDRYRNDNKQEAGTIHKAGKSSKENKEQ